MTPTIIYTTMSTGNAFWVYFKDIAPPHVRGVGFPTEPEPHFGDDDNNDSGNNSNTQLVFTTARHSSKHLTYFNSFNPHKNLWGSTIVFYSEGEKRLSNKPKVAWPISVRAGIQSKAVWLQSYAHNHSAMLPLPYSDKVAPSRPSKFFFLGVE